MTEHEPVVKTARDLRVGDMIHLSNTQILLVLGWRMLTGDVIMVRTKLTRLDTRIWKPAQELRVTLATDASRAEAEEVDGATDGYNPTTDFIPDYVAGERDD